MSEATTPSAGLILSADSAPEAKAQPVIHRRKFMDGRETPSEVHRRLGIGKRCVICKGPGAIRIRVLMPVEEAFKHAPNVMASIMATNPTNPGQLPTVKLKESATDTVGKDYIKASDVAFCSMCRLGAVKEAARGPSWAVVEIDEGISDIVQVGYGN